jgi:hypothetical protein
VTEQLVSAPAAGLDPRMNIADRASTAAATAARTRILRKKE